MAPEQARAEAVDNKQTCSALAGLYAMCTEIAFRAPRRLRFCARFARRSRNAFDHSTPMCSLAASLIGRLMMKDPARRFQSAAEVRIFSKATSRISVSRSRFCSELPHAEIEEERDPQLPSHEHRA